MSIFCPRCWNRRCLCAVCVYVWNVWHESIWHWVACMCKALQLEVSEVFKMCARVGHELCEIISVSSILSSGTSDVSRPLIGGISYSSNACVESRKPKHNCNRNCWSEAQWRQVQGTISHESTVTRMMVSVTRMMVLCQFHREHTYATNTAHCSTSVAMPVSHKVSPSMTDSRAKCKSYIETPCIWQKDTESLLRHVSLTRWNTHTFKMTRGSVEGEPSSVAGVVNTVMKCVR